MRLDLRSRIADYAWVVSTLFSKHPGLEDLSESVSVPPRPGSPVAVFLPGVGEGNEYLGPLARAFTSRGWQVRSGYLGGRTLRPVPYLASQIIDFVKDFDEPVVLIGHSKGGLVGRAVLTARIGGHRLDNVAGLVTVATPWYGSILARIFPRRSPIGTLVPGGPDIITPWSANRERAAQKIITSISPAWDPHVPGRSDLLAGKNRTAPITGHFRVLGNDATIAMVCDEASELLERFRSRRG